MDGDAFDVCRQCGISPCDPGSGLCGDCWDRHDEESQERDHDDYDEVAGSCDDCGCDIDSEEAVEGLCDQCSWWRQKAIHG